jgi:hypothetical protein
MLWESSSNNNNNNTKRQSSDEMEELSRLLRDSLSSPGSEKIKGRTRKIQRKLFNLKPNFETHQETQYK